MVLLELQVVEYNKSLIGLVPLRPSERFVCSFVLCSYLLMRKQIPTCLLYDEHGRILAWGLEAKNASPMLGTTRCEWFKLFLEPHALRDESAVDPRLPQLPVRIDICQCGYLLIFSIP
jgi:hypothetical protein